MLEVDVSWLLQTCNLTNAWVRRSPRLGVRGCLEMACFNGLGVVLAAPLSPPKLWSDILNSTQPPSQTQALPCAIIQSAIAAAWKPTTVRVDIQTPRRAP